MLFDKMKKGSFSCDEYLSLYKESSEFNALNEEE